MDTQVKLTQQVKLARYMILGTVIITVVSLILLLANSEMYIPYYAAAPYLLVQFGQNMDNILPGNMTTVGLALAAVILAIYLLVWYLAKDRPKWLVGGLVLLILDTLTQLSFMSFLQLQIIDIAFEIFLHGVVIYEIAAGISAQKKIEKISQ